MNEKNLQSFVVELAAIEIQQGKVVVRAKERESLKIKQEKSYAIAGPLVKARVQM